MKIRAAGFAAFLLLVSGCGSDLGVAWDADHTFTVENAGGGTITSDPAGIACPPTCSADFKYGTTVSLEPSADTDALFERFEGACTGTTCAIPLADDVAVSAVFSAPVRVTLAGPGAGLVVSDPPALLCADSCESRFDYGTVVTLSPEASAPVRFAGWLSGCAQAGACTIPVEGATDVIAGFGVVSSERFGGADQDEGRSAELDAVDAALIAGKVNSLSLGDIINGATGAYVGTWSLDIGLNFSWELEGSATIEPRGIGANPNNAIFVTGGVDTNGFVVRANANGFGDRQFDLESSQSAVGVDVVGLSDGRVASVGTFTGSVTVSVPGVICFGCTMNSDGTDDEDIWVTVASEALNGVERTRFGGTAPTDNSRATAVAASGNVIYVAGQFDGTFSGASVHASAGGWDSVVLALDSTTLLPLWSTSLGGLGDDILEDVTIDPASGDLVAVGRFGGTLNVAGQTLTAAGPSDALVVRMDAATGTPVWAVSFGGSATDNATGASFDRGEVLVGGFYDSEFVAGDLVRPSLGGSDLFVARLRVEDGQMTYADTWGGPGNDVIHGVTMSSSALVVTGAFEADVDFGDTVQTSEGMGDGFILTVHTE